METIKILGKKHNSVVKLVKLKNGNEVVVKYYPKHCKSMLVEMNILATCQHQNIVKLVELISTNENEPIGMTMEKEENSYIDVLCNKQLTHIEKIIFLLQIAYGIRYLHFNNIVHLDLKSENIMVTKGICKIIDFGSSEYLFTKILSTNQLKCTTTHRPPEGFNNGKEKANLNYAFDIWSFGMIMLETFTATPIYQNKHFPIYHKKDDGSYNFEYDDKFHKYLSSVNFGAYVYNKLPKELHDCLNLNPKFRPNINEIICTLTNMLSGLENKNFLNFHFDNSLALRTFPIIKSKNDINAIQYCTNIINSLNKNNNFDQVCNKILLWYTTSLTERLYSNLDNKKLNKNYIDLVITLSYYFMNIDNMLPLEKRFTKISLTNGKILNEIILATNGIVFHPNQYLH
ncbi:Serine/threonine protein kinase [Tupanvirus deep ocean]|uniref:Serine/threonine protein kinase n=2 Tax=Tupanvirus TaxID=2094720 RepID=A0AC62A7L2_9VIRU|nr:Serine/threonine protein kinase [Tupanvirus deep ocean]QKU33776.1 Serine/threonine protein kinase [Tupanvirus deep ocean]